MIYVCEPDLKGNELKYLNQCFKEGFISGTGGRFVKEFEEEFASWCGCKYAIAVTNGSTALQLLLSSLNIGKGDEVIFQSFTNAATCYAIVMNGAVPVAVDSEPDTWNIDPGQIENKITKRTKAIMVVHIYGHPVDMDPIMKIARKHKLFVFEDAAEAHGATYKGRKIGSIGDAACFSFYSNKIITTGEGGMITTNNKKLYENAQIQKNLGFSKKKRFLHFQMGYNYRMSNLQASIGLAQLERADEFIRKKRRLAEKYLNLLKDIPGITLPVEKPWAKNVYWMFGIVIEKEYGITRDELMKRLFDMSVETRQFFIPMHEQPVFKKMGFFKNIKLPVCEALGRKGLYLPSGINLKDNEIKYVADCIRKSAKK